MGKYKLLALDLDGTTLNSNNEILPATRNAIAAVREKGVKVVLVTGRHHEATRPYHFELELETPVICCNGTYIKDFAQVDPISCNPLDKEQASQILQTARDFDIYTIMYVKDAMTYESLIPHMKRFIAWGEAQPENVRPRIIRVEDFQQTIDSTDAVFKFVYFHDDPEVLKKACDRLQQTSNVSCERSWSDRMDVANGGNTKGGTLLRLAEEWGILPEEIIAVGDNDNDVSMVTRAGLGVAMGHSSEALMQVADLQIGSNDEDSIARLIEEYIL